MFIALAMRRRAIACAVFVGAAAACGTGRGQSADVVAQGPAARRAQSPRPSSGFSRPGIASPTPSSSMPALAAWPDETSSSVYTPVDHGADLPANKSTYNTAPPPVTSPDPESRSTSVGLTSDRDRRRLGPPSEDSQQSTVSPDRLADARSVLPKFGLPLESLYTTGSALAIVVGLFLLCIWALRRGARRSTALLPEDAVSVLGRVPLAARQFAQLVRVGKKLVLLSVTPAGAEPLTEITDPVEIDRLLGLCMQGKRHSSTSEFDDVFRELAKESESDPLLDRGSKQLAAGAATEAYAAYRGGAERG